MRQPGDVDGVIRVLVVASAFLGFCGEPVAVVAAPGPPRTAAATPSAASPTVPAEPGKRLPADTHQAVFVRTAGPGAIQARVTCFERRADVWAQVFPALSAVVGRNGVARPGEKREGDGCTPTGMFRLETAFGYAEHLKTGLKYRQATSQDLWIDDPESPDYNRWVTATGTARSFERMRRDDQLYKLGAIIEYNTQPVIPGHGSAIFLHIRSGADQPTAGCVALDEDDLAAMLEWLDNTKKPMIVIESTAVQ